MESGLLAVLTATHVLMYRSICLLLDFILSQYLRNDTLPKIKLYLKVVCGNFLIWPSQANLDIDCDPNSEAYLIKTRC